MRRVGTSLLRLLDLFFRVPRGEAEVCVGHFVGENGAEEKPGETIDNNDGGDAASRAKADGRFRESKTFLPGEFRAAHDAS